MTGQVAVVWEYSIALASSQLSSSGDLSQEVTLPPRQIAVLHLRKAYLIPEASKRCPFPGDPCF